MSSWRFNSLAGNTNETFKLRPYQEEISRKILQGENDIIVLPTNTGKTAVATNAMLQHLQQRCECSLNFIFSTHQLAVLGVDK